MMQFIPNMRQIDLADHFAERVRTGANVNNEQRIGP
jgi:hypothetical protein